MLITIQYNIKSNLKTFRIQIKSLILHQITKQLVPIDKSGFLNPLQLLIYGCPTLRYLIDRSSTGVGCDVSLGQFATTHVKREKTEWEGEKKWRIVESFENYRSETEESIVGTCSVEVLNENLDDRRLELWVLKHQLRVSRLRPQAVRGDHKRDIPTGHLVQIWLAYYLLKTKITPLNYNDFWFPQLSNSSIAILLMTNILMT